MLTVAQIVQQIQATSTNFTTDEDVKGVADLVAAQKSTQRYKKPIAFVVKTDFATNITHPYNVLPEAVDSFDVILAVDNRRDQEGVLAQVTADSYIAEINSSLETWIIDASKGYLPTRQVDVSFIGANLDVAWYRMGFQATRMAEPFWRAQVSGPLIFNWADDDAPKDFVNQTASILNLFGVVAAGVDTWEPHYWQGGFKQGEFITDRLYAFVRAGFLNIERTNPNVAKLPGFLEVEFVKRYSTRLNPMPTDALALNWLRSMMTVAWWKQWVIGPGQQLEGRAWMREEPSIDFPEDFERLG